MDKELIKIIPAGLFFLLLTASFLLLPILIWWYTGTNYIGIVFFYLISLILLIGQSLYTGAKSVSWPKVEGTIIENTYKVLNSKTDATLVLLYQYTINDQTFTNKTRSFSDRTDSPSALLEISKKYPLGSSVKVYYKQGDPQKSVLEPGVSKGNIVFVLLIAIGAAVCGYFAFRGWQGIPTDRLPTILQFLGLKR